jgi:hypothetical protein
VVRRFGRPKNSENHAGGKVTPGSGPSIPDRSNVGARGSVVPGPPEWGSGVGLTTAPQKNLLSRNHGEGQNAHRVVAQAKKKKMGQI